MTVIRPNSITGITSITALNDTISVYKSDGTTAGLQLDGVNFNTTGVSTVGQLNVGTGGTVITTTASGLVGLGTDNPKIECQIESSGGLQAVNTGEIALRYNVYYDGSDKYIQGSNKAASLVLNSDGEFRFYNTDTASSSANSSITGWTERLRIDSSGNLKVNTASAKILNSSGNPILQQTGSILQVVQTSKTDTFYSSTSETWYDITGMSATITPTSSTSKILVEFNLGKVAGLNNNAFRIMRNGSLMPGAGDAAGSRQQAHFTDSNQGRDGNHTGSLSYAYLDSPSSTSAVTYQLQVRAEVISSQGFGLNRTYNDSDLAQGYSARCSSTVVLMEVAA